MSDGKAKVLIALTRLLILVFLSEKVLVPWSSIRSVMMKMKKRSSNWQRQFRNWGLSSWRSLRVNKICWSNSRCLAGLYINMVELCKLIRPAMRMMKKLGELQFIKEVEQINVKLKPCGGKFWWLFLFQSRCIPDCLSKTERPNLATISRDNKRRHPTHWKTHTCCLGRNFRSCDRSIWRAIPTNEWRTTQDVWFRTVKQQLRGEYSGSCIQQHQDGTVRED